jgi:Domain of unknown function (DUF4377)
MLTTFLVLCGGAFSAACEPSAPASPPATPMSASSDRPSSSTETKASPATSAPTDGADAGQPTKTLFVREAFAPCVGEGPMKCMQVRQSEKDEWTLFYGRIEGFTYEEGNTYELRVEVRENPNPPAGGSSLRYRLVEVVSKEKVAPAKMH